MKCYVEKLWEDDRVYIYVFLCECIFKYRILCVYDPSYWLEIGDKLYLSSQISNVLSCNKKQSWN